MTPRKVKPANKRHDTKKGKACQEEAQHPERYSLPRRGMTPRKVKSVKKRHDI